MNSHERLAQDICYRLQVCFPDYRLTSEVWEQSFTTFLAIHLSSDGRDHWSELIPDRSGVERRIDMQSFHLQIPFPPTVDPTYAKTLQHFRQQVTERFVHEWFAFRLKQAGLEA